MVLATRSNAIQVLGGYGYARDFPVKQYYRDNRLNPIHKGANGIQAIDLLGRKVSMNDGRSMRAVATAMRADVAAAGTVPAVAASCGTARSRYRTARRDDSPGDGAPFPPRRCAGLEQCRVVHGPVRACRDCVDATSAGDGRSDPNSTHRAAVAGLLSGQAAHRAVFLPP